ncbi:VOC family protein [Paenibacillus puerhi]|uniref:VOC family protein n=1 Tax=Paenibacillus puerhi TaxID=2692622 RepID=UPI00135ACB11|nr:VOC family protein [Paenibacillus puerhi]
MSEDSRTLPGNSLKCICSVYVPVKNVLRSAEWWQRNFGLEYAVPYNPAEFQIILKLSDGQWLHLVETGEKIDSQFPDKAGFPMFRFTFEVREIEVLYNRLQVSDVQVADLEDRGSCGINFVFYDLDGNKFDVNEAVNAHRTPEEVERLKAQLFQYAQ